MTKLFARRNNGKLFRILTEGRPSRWRLWDPFRRISPFSTRDEQPECFKINFEIKETKDGFVLKADVPGFKEKDIEISMTGNQLTVSGKRKAAKEETDDLE